MKNELGSGPIDVARHARRISPGRVFPSYPQELAPMQGGIDRRTGSQIGKVRLGEGPPPPVAVDSAKYLLFKGLLHFATPLPARKNTTFFLQGKGLIRFSFHWSYDSYKMAS
jgi:hypothetical protein